MIFFIVARMTNQVFNDIQLILRSFQLRMEMSIARLVVDTGLDLLHRLIDCCICLIKLCDDFLSQISSS
jgi:hypothetical protein